MRSNPAVRKGEWFVCQNGHRIAQCLEDIQVSDVNAWAKKIGNWRIKNVPKIGDVHPRCDCGGHIMYGNGLMTERDYNAK